LRIVVKKDMAGKRRGPVKTIMKFSVILFFIHISGKSGQNGKSLYLINTKIKAIK